MVISPVVTISLVPVFTHRTRAPPPQPAPSVPGTRFFLQALTARGHCVGVMSPCLLFNLIPRLAFTPQWAALPLRPGPGRRPRPEVASSGRRAVSGKGPIARGREDGHQPEATGCA